MNGPAQRAARVVLIVQNPNAGAKSGRPVVKQLAELLRREGSQPEVVSDLSDYGNRLTELRETQQLHSVVAAGGDGTVSLLVNSTPPDVAIAICPLGTENLLAKQLGATPDPQHVCETILRGKPLSLDAGQANGRIFLLMAGCGFDGEVVRRMHRNRKGHINHWSYAKPIIDSIRSYRYPLLRVYCDTPGEAAVPLAESVPGKQLLAAGTAGSIPEEMTTISARWAFVVNLPRYAGGLQIAPDACGSDGLLDVCTFKKGSLVNGLKYLGGVLLRRHQSWTDFAVRRATRIRIEADEPVPYQLDGDPGGLLPLEIRILPARATVLSPNITKPHR